MQPLQNWTSSLHPLPVRSVRFSCFPFSTLTLTEQHPMLTVLVNTISPCLLCPTIEYLLSHANLLAALVTCHVLHNHHPPICNPPHTRHTDEYTYWSHWASGGSSPFLCPSLGFLTGWRWPQVFARLSIWGIWKRKKAKGGHCSTDRNAVVK